MLEEALGHSFHSENCENFRFCISELLMLDGCPDAPFLLDIDLPAFLRYRSAMAMTALSMWAERSILAFAHVALSWAGNFLLPVAVVCWQRSGFGSSCARDCACAQTCYDRCVEGRPLHHDVLMAACRREMAQARLSA